MIEVVDTEAARRALAAGRLRCPECAGTLRPWGRTRERTVVDHHGTRTVRPDRARCQTCGRTHTVLPAELLAGRSYTLGVIGPALAAGGLGVGHRRIAARLRVPAGTVRSWLRRARDNAAALYRLGVDTVVAIDQDRLPRTPRPTLLGDALEALAAAMAAAADRFALSNQNLWASLNALTRGRLLAPSP
ncbi:DUF6431 domain-containing protein [Saccharopolyspora hattusasensis]|uniref:DUF6431 domain-containing protein n=1 Tax=Saccharopolyspora hattusasensis TaxID=1128679 RepID=UPI003D975C92